MKTKTILTILAGIWLPTTLPAQDADAGADSPSQEPAAENQGPDQIVFVPKRLFTDSIPSGKLKENVFYWTNPRENPKAGPTAVQENGETFLRIEGDRNIPKTVKFRRDTESQTTVMRAYNVPKDAKVAYINITAKTSHDVWGDDYTEPGKADPGILSTTWFTRQGKSVAHGFSLQPVINAKNSGEWVDIAAQAKVIPGSEQFVIQMSTRAFKPLDIKSFAVTFE